VRKKLFVAIFCIVSYALFAQQGKDGSPTITTSVEVNEYTYLTANAIAGSTTITVASSTLNAHGRFSGNLVAGDLIMIIQMQGVTLNGYIGTQYDNVGLPSDSSWGSIVNYNNCGNYEFAEVSAVPSGTAITLDCPLQYNYIDTGRVQVVRIPRYSSLTINSGGNITGDPWDSLDGGIVAMEVEFNTIINSGGSINADSIGFRGGSLKGQDSIGWNVGWFSSTFQTLGKEKGEGIGGYEWKYNYNGGKEGMGAPGNGGGGGNVQNGGGGGGANGGIVANYINGFGNPDVSTANYRTAWALEFTWMPTFTSSGGGRGGYSYSGNNANPLTDPPGNTTEWGGDWRRNVGGRGGRPLDYSTGKIFMAGGGGAGDQNDNYGGHGGKGGGIVYLLSYGTISGAGQIIANGENGENTPDPIVGAGHASGIDAAGGGGGGGTIIVNSVGNISGISLTAEGGLGGNQVMNWDVSTDPEAEGPGGGGGGGYIATSNAGLTETTTGGANGTTNAIPMTNFPPNGATIGASITNFYITAVNDTICSGQTATLNATLNGTIPSGTTIEWYTASTGGTAIATGSTYTTPPLTATTTFYVGSCPGTYRVAVTVVISGSSSVSVGPDKTICKGTTDTLKASGGTAYSWTPTTRLSNANIADPIATPTITTTYSVSISTPCGNVEDSIKITVSAVPTPTITASNNPVCPNVSTTLSVSGGTSYTWSNSSTTSSISVSAASTTIYSVIVSNGACAIDTNITLTVNTSPTVTVNPPDPSICTNDNVTLNGVGATTYIWTPTTGLSCTSCVSTVATPTATTTYTVIGSNSSGCADTNTVVVTVNTKPIVNITPPTPTICTGGNVAFIASGANTYVWNPTTNLTCNTCFNPTATPTITTTYTVIGTGTGGCTDTTTVIVTVANTLTATITPPNDSVCAGSFITLTAGGGSTYLWSNGATTAAISVNPLMDTTFSVVVSSSGCKDSTAEAVSVLAVPVVGAGNNDSICNGSSTLLTASGASSYTWKPTAGLSCTGCQSPTATPSVTTTYTLTGSNASGCKDSSFVTVIVASPVIASISPPTVPPICAGDSVVLTGGGGGTYSWSNGATTSAITVKPTSLTVYKVVVSVGSCKDSMSVSVAVNPLPTVTISPDTGICSGNSVTLTATGGGTYLWNNSSSSTTSSITVNPSTTTNYTAAVTTSGCTKDTSVTVTVTSTQTVTISPPSLSSCYGTTDTLTVSGTGPYSWSNGSTSNTIVVNPGETNIYTVIVGPAGCTASAVDTVTVKSLPTITITPDTAICTGNSVTLTVTGGGTYLWNNSSSSTTGSISVAPSTTSTYTAQVTLEGCSKDTSVTVTVTSTQTVTITPNNVVSCFGTADTLTVSGTGPYSWSNGATTNNIIVNPASSGSYSVTVGPAGCSTSAKDSVKVKPLPSITLQGLQVVCSGGNTTLIATGGGTYLWSPGSETNSEITIAVATTTVYTLVVTKNGCSAEDTMQVTVLPLPTPSVNGPFTLCKGESASLAASGGDIYYWSPPGSLNDSAVSNPKATPASTTVYTVTMFDSAGCNARDSIKVIVLQATGSACCTNTITPGSSQPLSVTGAGSGSTYNWEPSENLSCSNCSDPTATPTITTWYKVTITDSIGCTTIDSILITVEAEKPECGNIFVPTAFSPDVTVNNILYVRGDCAASMEFDVFDRWGNKIFISNNINKGWDGNYNGQPMNMGTYVYYLTVTLMDGTTINKKGNITLVR
jgi:gliding motility-associated-like protein